MTVGGLFLALLGGLVALSLAAVVLMSLAWMVLPVVTVLTARRRARGHRAVADAFERFGGLYPEADLAEIDEALEAILAKEWPGALRGGR